MGGSVDNVNGHGRVAHPAGGRWAILAAPRAFGHVARLWFLEAAHELTWELLAPLIVPVENAEQSRETDAPAGAGIGPGAAWDCASPTAGLAKA